MIGYSADCTNVGVDDFDGVGVVVERDVDVGVVFFLFDDETVRSSVFASHQVLTPAEAHARE